MLVKGTVKGIIGICLRGHLRMRLLLLGTVVRPTEPIIVSLGVNSGDTTTCLPSGGRLMVVSAIATAIVKDALDTTVTG